MNNQTSSQHITIPNQPRISHPIVASDNPTQHILVHVNSNNQVEHLQPKTEKHQPSVVTTNTHTTISMEQITTSDPMAIKSHKIISAPPHHAMDVGEQKMQVRK